MMMRFSKAFSLLELAIVITLLAGLYAIGIKKLGHVYDTSKQAHIETIYHELKAGIYALNQRWYIMGQPMNHELVEIEDIKASYFQKHIFRVYSTDHIPEDVPAKALQSTRLWYLALAASTDINRPNIGWQSKKLTGDLKENFAWEFIEEGHVTATILYNGLTGKCYLTYTPKRLDGNGDFLVPASGNISMSEVAEVMNGEKDTDAKEDLKAETESKKENREN